MSFDRLIRFVDDEGKTSFGNLEKASAANDIVGTKVQVLQGNLENGFTKTDEKRVVQKVRAHVPIPFRQIMLI